MKKTQSNAVDYMGHPYHTMYTGCPTIGIKKQIDTSGSRASASAIYLESASQLLFLAVAILFRCDDAHNTEHSGPNNRKNMHACKLNTLMRLKPSTEFGLLLSSTVHGYFLLNDRENNRLQMVGGRERERER